MSRAWGAALLLPALAGCEPSLDVELTAAGRDGVTDVVLPVIAVRLLDNANGSHAYEVDPALDDDLLDHLDGARTPLLGGAEPDTRGYAGITLGFDLDEALVRTSDGAAYPVVMTAEPDYADLDLDVADGDSVDIVVALDLRFSLADRRSSLGSYQLAPVLRAVKRGRAALIAGTVSRSLVESDGCRDGRSAGIGVAVYAYAGHGVTPADYVRGTTGSGMPVASAAVRGGDDGTYRYVLAALAPGDYTLALTCDGDADDPHSSDELSFRATAQLTLDSGEEATLHLP